VSACGVSVDLAISRLVTMRPVKGRMMISQCLGGTLVDDSYNANPGSVRAAIDWLAQQPGPQALVLGDIAELGADEVMLHQQVGAYARQAGLTALIAHGDLAAQAATVFGEGASCVGSHVEAADEASLILAQHGTVLIKGSRSARMDTVVTALQAQGETH
jgi:UDP-N-acetylmuramoyl-tripeptide--D-alanyl-D-alanine ligase